MNVFISDPTGLRSMTTEIVAAYLSKNHVPPTDVPNLVIIVHGALASLAQGNAVSAADEEPQRTPAEIRKSITPDALISFLDGKPYKTLKRHIGLHGLNADSYRAKFGLPADYPMTAPGYSARRSELAKSLGLGFWRSAAEKEK